jgi:hypothetical protein
MPCTSITYASIRQHTSAYVSIRHTDELACPAPTFQASHPAAHTSAFVRIRQHTSAYVSIRQRTSYLHQHSKRLKTSRIQQHCSASCYSKTRPSDPKSRQRCTLEQRQYLYFCTSKASKLSIWHPRSPQRCSYFVQRRANTTRPSLYF